YYYTTHHVLPSFPTRRSSDLAVGIFASEDVVEGCYGDEVLRSICENDPPTVRGIMAFRRENRRLLQWLLVELLKQAIRYHVNARSEEHTSELQSSYDLVCRLL